MFIFTLIRPAATFSPGGRRNPFACLGVNSRLLRLANGKGLVSGQNNRTVSRAPMRA